MLRFHVKSNKSNCELEEFCNLTIHTHLCNTSIKANSNRHFLQFFRGTKRNLLRTNLLNFYQWWKMGRDQWWSISSNMRSMRPRRSLCWPHPTVQAASNYWETFSLDFLTIVQIRLLKHRQWLNQRFKFCGRLLLPGADVLYSRQQLQKISKLNLK